MTSLLRLRRGARLHGSGRLRLVALLSFLWVLGAHSVRADTDHVRELAKNKPPILIVGSGPEAVEVGKNLQSTILRHGDNRHQPGDVAVVSLRLADATTGGQDLNRWTVIFLLSRDEMPSRVPERIAALMPADLSGDTSKVSTVRSVLRNARAGEPIYHITLSAPDAPRLKRLLGVFTDRKAGDFRALPFDARFVSNKIAVFSAPEHRDALARWGEVSDKNTWNFVTWHALGDRERLTAEDLAEHQEVYFLDRSRRDAVPSPAAQALAGQRIVPTSVLITRASTAPVTVFSAPSGRILLRKARHYTSLRNTPASGTHEEAVDLRGMRTAVLLAGGTIEPAEREALRDRVASEMRQKLGVPIDEAALGAFGREATLRDLQESPERVRRLRGSGALRYAWLLTVNDYGGTTEYRGGERQVTPDMEPFTDTEPEEPSTRDRDRNSDKYYKDLEEWRRKHRRWREKRDEWRDQYNNANVVWERAIDRTSTARTQLSLKLIDLDNGGRVLWESQGTHTDVVTGPYQSDRVTMRGYDRRPNALPLPAPTNQVPEQLLRSTAFVAATQTLNTLEEEIWLPDGTGSIDTPSTPDAPPANAGSAFAQVAAVDGSTVTLTAGVAEGLKVGDLVTVLTRVRTIKHPQTGAILETIVQDTLTLRLTRVGVTADGVPFNSEDAVKIGQVKVGMSVQRAR